MNFTIRTLKVGLLLFWALWLSIVLLTNVGDALKELDVLPDDWTIASGNYDFMVLTTKIHDTPTWVNAVLFAGVIVWQALGVYFFWAAVNATRGGGSPRSHHAAQAIVMSAALWAAFMIADEGFLAYETEKTHLGLFTLLLASALILWLVPDEVASDHAGS
jgi:hypothetical protein